MSRMSQFGKLLSAAFQTASPRRLQGHFQNICRWSSRQIGLGGTFADSSSPSSSKLSPYQRLEHYLHLAYIVLSWQQPVYTVGICAIFHLIVFAMLFLDYSIIGSIYWTSLVVFLSDTLIESFIFKLDFLKKYPIEPKVSIFIKNLVILAAKGAEYLKQLHVNKQDTVCVYLASGFILLLLLLVTLSNLVYLYLFTMMLFMGPMLLTYYFPKFVDKLFESLQIMISSDDIKEDDLLPNQSLERDCDNDSVASDLSTDSYITSMVKSVKIMPSHLEVDGSSDEFVPNLENIVEENDEDLELLDEDLNLSMTKRGDTIDPNKIMSSVRSNIELVTNYSTNMITNIWNDTIANANDFVDASFRKSNQKQQSDNSDSDFEIISKDELNNTMTPSISESKSSSSCSSDLELT